MGGVDKGLQNFNQVALAQHTLTRLQRGNGVGKIMINANRNIAAYEAYEAFGVSVWPDSISDYAGPLAGFLTGLEHCETPYLLTVPCDTPLFPMDLAQRLARALESDHADIAMAAAPEVGKNGLVQLRQQPVFCLLRVELRTSLVRFTQDGGRKAGAWTALHPTAMVAFDRPDDDPLAFSNANTLAELQQLETRNT